MIDGRELHTFPSGSKKKKKTCHNKYFVHIYVYCIIPGIILYYIIIYHIILHVYYMYIICICICILYDIHYILLRHPTVAINNTYSPAARGS